MEGALVRAESRRPDTEPGTRCLGPDVWASVQVVPDDGGIAQGWEYCYGHIGVGQEGNGLYGNQALIRIRAPGPAE